MISLVEAIQGLQNYQNLLEPPNIRYYYAFALNRRNGKGDREKALSIIKDVSLASLMKLFPEYIDLSILFVWYFAPPPRPGDWNLYKAFSRSLWPRGTNIQGSIRGIKLYRQGVPGKGYRELSKGLPGVV